MRSVARRTCTGLSIRNGAVYNYGMPRDRWSLITRQRVEPRKVYRGDRRDAPYGWNKSHGRDLYVYAPGVKKGAKPRKPPKKVTHKPSKKPGNTHAKQAKKVQLPVQGRNRVPIEANQNNWRPGPLNVPSRDRVNGGDHSKSKAAKSKSGSKSKSNSAKSKSAKDKAARERAAKDKTAKAKAAKARAAKAKAAKAKAANAKSANAKPGSGRGGSGGQGHSGGQGNGGGKGGGKGKGGGDRAAACKANPDLPFCKRGS